MMTTADEKEGRKKDVRLNVTDCRVKVGHAKVVASVCAKLLYIDQ